MSSACRLNVFPPPPHFLSVEEMSFILFGTTCPSLFGDYNPHIISLSIFSASFSTYLFHSCTKTCSSPIVKYVPYIPSPTLVLSLEDLISCHQLLTSPLPSFSSFFPLALFSLISNYVIEIIAKFTSKFQCLFHLAFLQFNTARKIFLLFKLTI